MFADMNGDGAQDALVLHRGAGATPGRLYVYLNTCSGDYFDGEGSASYDLTNQDQVDLVVADLLGGDGVPDVACISHGDGSDPHILAIFENDGAGALSLFEEFDLTDANSNSGGEGARDVAAGDLDSDADPDLVIAGGLSQSTALWTLWNDGGGNFDLTYAEVVDCTASTATTSSLPCVAIADLDQQDGGDIVIGTDQEHCELRVFLNQGGTPGGDHTTRFDFSDPAADDFDLPDTPVDLVSGRFNDDGGETEYADLAVGLDQGDAKPRLMVLLNQWPATDGQNIIGGPGTTFTYLFSRRVNDDHRVERALAVGDLDGDGFDDIVGGNSQSVTRPGAITVLNNLTFASGSAFGGSARWIPQPARFNKDYICHRPPADVALADVNADGSLDAVTFGPYSDEPGTTSAYDGFMSVLLGDCQGGLQVQDRYWHQRRVATDIKSAHLGGVQDGLDRDLLDLVVSTSSFRRGIMVWRQQADGSFEMTQDVPASTAQETSLPGLPWAVAIADYDGQNTDDVAVVTSGEAVTNGSGVHIFLSDSTGRLIDAGHEFVDVNLPAGSALDGTDPVGIDAGDINTDGHPDLAVCDLPIIGGAIVHILTNDGSGHFDDPGDPISMTDGVTFVDDPVDVILVDLDNNGIPDVVTANHLSNNFSVALNPTDLDQDGTYTAEEVSVYALGLNARPQGVAYSDFDDDGDVDLVVANSLRNSVTVAFNDGSGHFSVEDMFEYVVGLVPSAIVACELDLNGLPDIVTVDRDDDTLSILLNDPDIAGTFHEEDRVIVSGDNITTDREPSGMDCADLDNSGAPDIVHLTRHEWGPHPYTTFRVTYNDKVQVDLCDLKGDMNFDGLVDGDDVQRFVDTYFFFTGQDTSEVDDPTPAEFCAADIVADGVLDPARSRLLRAHAPWIPVRAMRAGGGRRCRPV